MNFLLHMLFSHNNIQEICSLYFFLFCIIFYIMVYIYVHIHTHFWDSINYLSIHTYICFETLLYLLNSKAFFNTSFLFMVLLPSQCHIIDTSSYGSFNFTESIIS